MFRRRTIGIAACFVLCLHVGVIARMPGTRMAALFSNLLQVVLGILCLLAFLQVMLRSGHPLRSRWTCFSLSLVAWVIAQVLGSYIDLSSRHSLDPVDDALFFLSIAPIAMLLFLNPDHEHTLFDRLHLLDFIQVSGFWLNVYIYFVNSARLALTTVGWAGFGWTSSLVFNGVLTLSFVLRSAVVKSRADRVFFSVMAAYVLLSGLADSYAAYQGNGVQPGNWFDIVWTFLLGIPLTIALTWKQHEPLSPAREARAHRVLVNEFFPLVYPFFALLFLVQDARWQPALSSGIAGTIFVAVGVRILIIQHRLLRAQAALEFEASHDALTAIWNRASILDALGKELQRQKRTGEPLAVLIADVDHFKKVNDTYGHLVGDQVLAEVAHRFAASVRPYDSTGRYGGEEFLIVVPSCDAHGAMIAAERLRASIEQASFVTSAGVISISVSLGFVSTAECPIQPTSSMLLRLADEALYAAKTHGRNRSEAASSCPSTSCPQPETSNLGLVAQPPGS